MLTNDMMFRYQRDLPLGGEDPQVRKRELESSLTAQVPGPLSMTAVVLGNALAGGLFLGVLLMLPLVLERLLAMP